MISLILDKSVFQRIAERPTCGQKQVWKHLHGHFQVVIPALLIEEVIVNNASVGALTGKPGIASYIASKHGVIGLTRTAALEYPRKGIRVNAVNPGLIGTQIGHDVFKGDEPIYAEAARSVSIGRAGRPEEIASVVLWLCSPGASYVVGHSLTADGGMKVA